MLMVLTAGMVSPALAQEETKVEQWMRLRRQLSDACQNRDYRDRAGDDSFVYRIGDQRFVSWQDVDALMAVMEARVQFQQWELENKTDEGYLQQVRESITEPDEELAQSLLLGQMFLLAEADARGIAEGEIVKLMGRHQRREDWADIVPDGADPSDPDVLVRRGLISLRSWLEGLSGPTDSPLPYEDDTDLINALIEQLAGKYPHVEADVAPTPVPLLPPVIELSREAHRLAGEMAKRDRSGDTPIYRIDEQRFVSQQDVEDHLGIMRVGVELKKLAGESAWKIVKPTEGYVEDLLVRRLLLQAEADALGLGEDGLEAAYKAYLRYGWQQDLGFDLGEAIAKSDGKLDMDELKRQIEAQMNAPSSAPDAPTAETLVLEGWVRVQLAMNDLMSSSTSELPYTNHQQLIDDLIEQLKRKHPSTAAVP